MYACLPACLPAYVSVCVHVCMQACMHASCPTCVDSACMRLYECVYAFVMYL